MKIQIVTEANFSQALAVYTESWRESHREICSPEFLESRDYAGYLRQRMDGLYLVTDGGAVGVFRLADGTLSDLYISPDRMGRGYGTACIRFALEQCRELGLTVLSSNDRAIRLYEKMGFRFTGRDIQLKNGLLEREMRYTEKHNG